VVAEGDISFVMRRLFRRKRVLESAERDRRRCGGRMAIPVKGENQTDPGLVEALFLGFMSRALLGEVLLALIR